MRELFAVLSCLAIVSGTGAAVACDLCAIYRATEAKTTKPGFSAGVYEQYTRFGTLRDGGKKVDNEADQFLDSSITQLLLGYRFNERIGVQVNVPYIHRSFKRPEGGAIDEGTVSGIGDVALVGTARVYQRLREESTFLWIALGGVKFPTGSTDRLREETNEMEPAPGEPESGIHGHDLTLGSGSYDFIVGTDAYWRWKRLFATAGVHYSIRTEGDFDYRFANDLIYSVKPGVYLWLSDEGTLGLQLAVTGEAKGKDKFRGQEAADTGITSLFLGPEASLTWHENLSAELAADFPVVENNTSLQIVPDYRLRGAVNWRF
ncbi:MAG: transporter [Deltaproteobacteria bacterium]|nr:transporter [Deltaproteobacteria bacterium]PWB66889.1 MAG: hypothetical protein C3F14_03325 [Deltaproteobacteria bacterium]